MTDTQDMSKIDLQIKSLEQRTTSVTLPRNASVLQLKQEIQVVFDVESNRQRLIFQGKVLKDDKNLDDYANLDNGKVVHLVIRPQDAPRNPVNDNPTSQARSIRGIPGRIPMMEGYAFITLDSADTGDNHSLLSSVLNGLASGRHAEMPGSRPTETHGIRPTDPTTNRHTETPGNRLTETSNANRPTTPSVLRPPFAFSFGHRDQRSPLASSALGIPPSAEVRLARTLASMRNVRTMIQQSNDIPSILSVNSTAEQLQEIRNTLRTDGGNQISQVAMALDELADLTLETVPRMREISQSLREPTENRDLNRRVLYTSRIVQGMSLINHFMGSVLSTIDIDSRRSRESGGNVPPASDSLASSVPTTSDTPSSAPSSNVRQSSRGETQALRTSAPTVAEAEAGKSNEQKRKLKEDADESIKKFKQEDGKGKNKLDK